MSFVPREQGHLGTQFRIICRYSCPSCVRNVVRCLNNNDSVGGTARLLRQLVSGAESNYAGADDSSSTFMRGKEKRVYIPIEKEG